LLAVFILLLISGDSYPLNQQEIKSQQTEHTYLTKNLEDQLKEIFKDLEK
jgi:hypothetical protein